jgi:[acyl-carrier-protein] S-malonyltransferase
MSNIAFLFPGQGAQYPGMGKDFYDTFSMARQTFEEADDLLSFHLSQVIFDGPESLLTETRHSQAAIFVNSVAILRTLQQQFPNLQSQVCAGLSLGEYTALFASGRIGFAECLRLVQLRANLLNEACERTKGSMSAILGLSANEVEAIISSLNHLNSVWVANFNCPGQTVISGTCDGVAAASLVLKECGAKRIIPLQVHGAFHSGLMQCAQDKLAPAIERADIRESNIGIVMNVPGSYVDGICSIKDNLKRQVTHSVRWEQGIRAMMQRHVDLYIEIGCSKTLAGMNRKMGMPEPTISIDKVPDLDGLASQMIISKGRD